MTTGAEKVDKASMVKRGLLAVGWALAAIVCVAFGLWTVYRSQRPRPILFLNELVKPFTVLKREEACESAFQEILELPEDRVVTVQLQDPETEVIKRARAVLVPKGFVEDKVLQITSFTHPDGTMITISTRKGVVSVETAYVGGSLSQFVEDKTGRRLP